MCHISALPGQREPLTFQAALYSCWVTDSMDLCGTPKSRIKRWKSFLLQESDHSGWLSLISGRVCRKTGSISWLKTELSGSDFHLEASRINSLWTLTWKGLKISEQQSSVVEHETGSPVMLMSLNMILPQTAGSLGGGQFTFWPQFHLCKLRVMTIAHQPQRDSED